jgi:hypothetical protein
VSDSANAESLFIKVGGVTLDRTIKLFLALVVTMLLFYMPESKVPLFRILTFDSLDQITDGVFDVIKTIAFFLFLKVVFLWVKEIWSLK